MIRAEKEIAKLVREGRFYRHLRVYKFLRQEYKDTFCDLFRNAPYKKYTGVDYVEHIVDSMRNNK